jgi:riboflavin synthase
VFTGIVEERGVVVALNRQSDSAKLIIDGPAVTAAARCGDSVAVNGVCLTMTELAGTAFTADVMGETLARSSLGALTPGAPVNLERPVPAGGRLDGHIVQGHVDGTGLVIDIRPAENWRVLRIGVPGELLRYLAVKGSLAVDGVSLTVSGLSAPTAGEADAGDVAVAMAGGWCEVSLIPQTLAVTTLGTSQIGDVVNLEVDVIAKYVERLLGCGARS